jgi:hypothetical protein
VRHAGAPPNKQQLDGIVEVLAAGGLLRVRARARPLPAETAAAIEQSAALVDALARCPPEAPLDAEMQELVAFVHERFAAAADSSKVHAAGHCAASASSLAVSGLVLASWRDAWLPSLCILPLNQHVAPCIADWTASKQACRHM